MKAPLAKGRRSGSWVLALLVLPYIALLVPSWYASADPRLFGVPFFVWYQFLWVILGVALTGAVYMVYRFPEDR
jgi:hypothetical protein